MTSDVGLFDRDSLTWRLNAEPALLAGGGRAVLLQIAHPLVAAGVAQHSDFERDPWRRLWRTLVIVGGITFGDERTSAMAVARLRAAHGPVRGVSPDGSAYDARDPDLNLWVWATLVDSVIEVHRRFLRPLGPDELARYYAEQLRFAEACGVPDGVCPPDYAAFRAYFDAAVAGGISPSQDSRDITRAVLQPKLPPPLRPLVVPFRLLTTWMLPPALRAPLGLEWDERRERLARALAAVARTLVPVVPAPLRRGLVRRSNLAVNRRWNERAGGPGR